MMASKSERPKAILNQITAALACITEAYQIDNPVNTEIYHLVQGLIKGGTVKPMLRSKSMLTEPFMKLFQSWPGNWFLPLLALSIMLQPSDIGPRSKVFNDNTNTYENLILTTDMVSFGSNGSLTISLLGIKNDYSRDGFQVIIQPCIALVQIICDNNVLFYMYIWP